MRRKKRTTVDGSTCLDCRIFSRLQPVREVRWRHPVIQAFPAAAGPQVGFGTAWPLLIAGAVTLRRAALAPFPAAEFPQNRICPAGLYPVRDRATCRPDLNSKTRRT